MTSEEINELRDRFQSLTANKTAEDLIKEDEYALMANYLSEIERLKSEVGFSRKELAKKINTSPSYLTQVFRGDKPLNFHTLAKIQNALNIRFEVKAIPMYATVSNDLKRALSIKLNPVTLTVIPGKLFDITKSKAS